MGKRIRNGRMWVRAGVAAAACVLVPAARASAQQIGQFAVFGKEAVIYEGFTKTLGASVGSNGYIQQLGASGEFTGLRGGGRFIGDQATQKVSGDVIFNGDVLIGSLGTIGGSVSSAGSIISSADIGGSLTAARDIRTGSFNKIGGTVAAGRDLFLGSSAQVGGNLAGNRDVTMDIYSKVTGGVTYGGGLNMSDTATAGSVSHGPVLVSPTAYTPVVVPAADVFSAGGQDLFLETFEKQTLAPGKYGGITFQGSNKLRLSSGNYYFDSIHSLGHFVDLDLDLTAGPISIFVTGPVYLKSLNPIVNGVAFDKADPMLAASVFLESLGEVDIEGKFFGTIFTPSSDLRIDTLGKVTGSLLSGHEVHLGSSTDITYVASANPAVPEPAGLGLCVMAAGLCLRRRRH